MTLFKVLIVCNLLLLSLSANAEILKPLPPILNYLPNCDYEIVSSTKIKVKTNEPQSEETNKQLLQSLQKRALKNGAEAILLTGKSIKRKYTHKGMRSSAYIFTYQLSYEADFINRCEDNKTSNRKLASYDEFGNKTVELKGLNTNLTPLTITIPAPEKLNRPIVVNKSISLSDGLYGIQLNSTLNEVKKAFGTPSVILYINQSDKLISYGRRHWLYFKSDKLKKVQSKSPLLSFTLLNKIPMLDQFDNNRWKLENQLTYGMNLLDVQSYLNNYNKLNPQNQLVIESKNKTLLLNFTLDVNSRADSKNYILDGFEFKLSSFKDVVPQIKSNASTQYSIISKAYEKLQFEQNVDWLQILQNLGEPLGIIQLSMQEQINIYGSQLLINIKKSTPRSIYFSEQVFLNNLSNNPVAWQIGPYSQGSLLKNVTNSLPETTFNIDNQIEIETDNYSLFLFFDKSHNDRLYEAKLQLY